MPSFRNVFNYISTEPEIEILPNLFQIFLFLHMYLKSQVVREGTWELLINLTVSTH